MKKRKSPLKMKTSAAGTLIYDLHQAFQALGNEFVTGGSKACGITTATFRAWKNNPRKCSSEDRAKIVNVALDLIIKINTLFERGVGELPTNVKFPTKRVIKLPIEPI